MSPVWDDGTSGPRASLTQRVRSFTQETARNNTGVYIWSGLEPGTYLYHSGTHPALQVQMGLYGGLKKDVASGQAYPGVPYDRDVTVFFSEVDTALHLAVAADNYGPGKAVTSTFDYKPRYFLINGASYPDTQPLLVTGTTGEKVLLRFLNAGLETHVPMLNGLSMSLVAEDGNKYPYAKDQYSLLLTAGKTSDAVLTWPGGNSQYAVFDRRLRLTNGAASGGGMLAYLTVDSDGDGVADTQDNCTLVANANQRDTNGDGYGNICDPDLNNDGIVNIADLTLMRSSIGTTNADADLNGDGIVNIADITLLRSYVGHPPGPSGLVP